jgi:hypothetical protein
VLAGGVEGSKLCLFSVIMPAKCVSGISPRLHFLLPPSSRHLGILYLIFQRISFLFH